MGFIETMARVVVETFTAPLQQSLVDRETGQTERPPILREPMTLGAGQPTQRPGQHKAELKPAFKLAVITVLAITVLSGMAEIALANVWSVPTPNQQSAFEGFNFAWKAGIGAILGLIGGKAA